MPTAGSLLVLVDARLKRAASAVENGARGLVFSLRSPSIAIALNEKDQCWVEELTEISFASKNTLEEFSASFIEPLEAVVCPAMYWLAGRTTPVTVTMSPL
jgi:hypothetical protein